MPRISLFSCAPIVCLLACADAGDDPTESAADAQTSAVDSTGPAPTTEAPTTGDDTTSSSSGPTTSETSSSSDASSSSTASTTADRPCAPQPTDDECIACTRGMCCTELSACLEANAACVCALECIAELRDPQGMDYMTCASNCGVGHEAMAQLQAVLDCQTSSSCDACGAADGGGHGSSSGPTTGP